MLGVAALVGVGDGRVQTKLDKDGFGKIHPASINPSVKDRGRTSVELTLVDVEEDSVRICNMHPASINPSVKNRGRSIGIQKPS
jgi:hypothetical protein